MKFLLISIVVLFVSVAAIGNPFGGGGGGNKGTPKCPEMYTLMNRSDHRHWCMKYVAGNESFFEAEKICRCQGGGSLSGIENTNELKWVMQQAEKSFNETGVITGGVWVGAYRRAECRAEKMDDQCTKDKQYQWTDRYTTGKDLWETHWTNGAPHNNKIDSHQEFCVHLQVSFDPALADKNITGFFDNRVCVKDGETQFPTKGFICGRPPKYSGYNDGYSGGGNYGNIWIGAGKPEKKP